MKNNQRGFGAVEGLLMVVIVLLVGFIGYYVYHSTSKTKTTYNNISQTSTASTTTAKTHTSQEAVTFVQKTYDDFLTALNNANNKSTNTQPVAQVGLMAVKSNLSPELYTKASAATQATPFSCTAQFVTDKYTASLASSDKQNAVVSVSISNGDGQSTGGMTATVDLASLKITSVSCPS